MSDQMLGADLAHLEDLSLAFQKAGAEIAAKATTLRGKIDTSVDTFMAALDTLTRETATLTTAIDTEIDGVATQSGTVEWTGNNRLAFDGDLGAFTGAVKAGTTAINTDIGTLRSEVSTRFTPVLTEFGAALGISADDVDSRAVLMQGSVTNQRSNLDEAGNVGWMSA